MRILYFKLILLSLIFISGCQKENNSSILADGSVSIAQIGDRDTIEIPLSILQDSTIILNIEAVLSEQTAKKDHRVSFTIDPGKLSTYRNQYGDAKILPISNYLFFKKDVLISSGSSLSDKAEINIGLQTKLEEYSTYVLPIVIKSVDGQIEGPASSEVLYLVFKTGRPLFINRTGWKIDSYSSQFNNFIATNAIDNDDVQTYWTSDITQQMPQWININFNREITFNGVTYFLPELLGYPNNGGYPSSIRIETSMDGVSWEDKGVFAGNISNNRQTLDLSTTTAKHLKFTVLSAVKYANIYDAIFISGISLVP